MIRRRRSQRFRTITVVDFEYEINDGELPRVLCMVAYVHDENFRHIRTVRMWRGDFGATPPFDIGPDALIIGYSLWAEMTCFLTFGWKFPVHVFDLHTAYLATSNILLPYEPDETRKKPRKKLQDACCAYDIRVGKISTKATWPRTSATGSGASMVRPPCSIIARRTLRNRPSCSAAK